MKTKAAVLYEYNKPLEIEELELDGPKEGEVLVRYKAAGLCHSDLSVIKGVIAPNPPLPCVLGHEGAGIVEEVGKNVKRVKPGDHVTLLWIPVCGHCFFCLRGQPYLCTLKDITKTGVMLDGTHRQRKGEQNINKFIGVGSFSEYQVVNEESVVRIEKDIPFDAASITGCAILTGVGAVLNTAKVKAGSNVAVVGIGGVGLNVIQGSVLANATKIIAIDVLDNKLEMAKQFGATHIVNATKEDPIKKVLELTENIGADYAFEVLGKPETAQTVFQITRRGGYSVFVGVSGMEEVVSLPMMHFSLMEKSVLGCYAGSSNLLVDIITFLNLYKNGRLKIDELITNRYSLEEINKGFDDMVDGKNARGVIIY